MDDKKNIFKKYVIDEQKYDFIQTGQGSKYPSSNINLDDLVAKYKNEFKISARKKSEKRKKKRLTQFEKFDVIRDCNDNMLNENDINWNEEMPESAESDDLSYDSDIESYGKFKYYFFLHNY